MSSPGGTDISVWHARLLSMSPTQPAASNAELRDSRHTLWLTYIHCSCYRAKRAKPRAPPDVLPCLAIRPAPMTRSRPSNVTNSFRCELRLSLSTLSVCQWLWSHQGVLRRRFWFCDSLDTPSWGGRTDTPPSAGYDRQKGSPGKRKKAKHEAREVLWPCEGCLRLSTFDLALSHAPLGTRYAMGRAWQINGAPRHT
ncbi:hypothetical protein LY76DRAFT_183088 [Colletotrichum caudatum]|nr:hypothetical protein LY76DRAFT_183088 [Colletotrichum caudatum]